MSTCRMHYPAYSALMLQSTLSLGIRTTLAYCPIRHSGTKLFISTAVERAKCGPSAMLKTFKDVSSLGSSQAFFNTEQYNLTAFISIQERCSHHIQCGIVMLQDKSNKWEAWKDEYVCICLRFFEHYRANVCSALHTEIKWQKMQRKKLLNTSFMQKTE